MEKEKAVQVGFFPDFKGSDSLLFSGGANSLNEFSKFLVTLGGTEPISLNSFGLFKFKDELQVEIKIIKEFGTASIDFTSGSKLILYVPKNLLVSFSSLIESVANSKHPCHQYLECDKDINFIISKGEYDDLFD